MTEEKIYKNVDINGLADCLAQDAFKEETKNHPEEDLHETLVLPGGETKKQIKPQWVNTFFNLKTSFLRLINEFVKT